MDLPRPDESAYDGNLVVKSTTFGKSNRGKVSGIDKIRQSIVSLNAEAEKRLTIDRLDPKDTLSIEQQVIVNKEVSAVLRKEALKLTTFVKNNS